MVGCGEGVVYLTSLGAQLILAYSWARPAILVAGNGSSGVGGRGGEDGGGNFLYMA